MLKHTDKYLYSFVETPLFTDIISKIYQKEELSGQEERFMEEVASTPLKSTLSQWNHFSKWYVEVLRPNDDHP